MRAVIALLMSKRRWRGGGERDDSGCGGDWGRNWGREGKAVVLSEVVLVVLVFEVGGRRAHVYSVDCYPRVDVSLLLLLFFGGRVGTRRRGGVEGRVWQLLDLRGRRREREHEYFCYCFP